MRLLYASHRNLPAGRQERLRNAVLRRLEAPGIACLRGAGPDGPMASTHSKLIASMRMDAPTAEMSRNGRSQRTTATSVWTEAGGRYRSGDRCIDYQVTFEVINNGRSLRVTRSIADEELARPVVARSVYDRIRDIAQWDLRRDVYPRLRAAGRAVGLFRSEPQWLRR